MFHPILGITNSNKHHDLGRWDLPFGTCTMLHLFAEDQICGPLDYHEWDAWFVVLKVGVQFESRLFFLNRDRDRWSSIHVHRDFFKYPPDPLSLDCHEFGWLVVPYAIWDHLSLSSLPPCQVLDCAWGNWSAWTECTVSCGGGLTFLFKVSGRMRICQQESCNKSNVHVMAWVSVIAKDKQGN